MKKLGVIGLGNMGSAIIFGINSSSIKEEFEIYGYDVDSEKNEKLRTMTKIKIPDTIDNLINDVEIILLAIKPQEMKGFLTKYHTPIDVESKIVLTIAAGLPIRFYRKFITRARIVRAMPNTPLLVNYGATGLYFDGDFSSEEKNLIIGIFSSSGIAEEVKKEELLDVITGLSGSGPAYVFTFINSLADGGVLEGLPRNIAIRFAIQTVLGAALLARNSNEAGVHLEELKDRVTSPGGTTARGLLALEEGAFRSDVIKAVKSATERARELSREFE